MRTLLNVRSRRSRGQRGAAAVEFALILPLFLLLLVGMIQYSFYFFSAQSGAATAREAARRAAVGDQDCTAMATAATSNVRLAQTAVTASRQYFAATDTGFVTPVAAAVGTNVRVTISYRTVDLNFPLLPFIDNAEVSEVAFARLENPTANSVACP